MEIITIPLEGDLEHKDSMGNGAIIKNGDIQVMSAGTGITHSEFNANKDKPVKVLQIWLFPNKRNLVPRYDQLSLSTLEKRTNSIKFYHHRRMIKVFGFIKMHGLAWLISQKKHS